MATHAHVPRAVGGGGSTRPTVSPKDAIAEGKMLSFRARYSDIVTLRHAANLRGISMSELIRAALELLLAEPGESAANPQRISSRTGG